MNRPKSPDELSGQLSQTEEVLGTEFFKDPKRREEALRADQRELQLKYPYRWDQYKKIVKGEAQAAEFTSARNYIRLINNLEGYIDSYEQGRPEGFLREHQQDTFHELARFFNAGHKSGYMDLPTGSGKTVTFVELVKALAGSRNGRAPLKTLVLVPSKDLVIQTMGRDGKRGFGKFAPQFKVTPYYMDEKDLTGDVVVATYSSFNILKKSGKIDANFADLIICDEAHKALGRVTSKEIESISPEAIKIALTATSEYSEEKKVSNLFPELIHTIDLEEAIKLGILSNVQGFLYKTNIKVDSGKLHGDEDYSEEVLAQLDKEARNRAAVKFAKIFAERGLQGIIPCLPGNKLAHAYKIEEICNQEIITDPLTKKSRPMVVKTIAGTMSSAERQKLYELYDEGGIDAFTYVGTLEAGWDHDRAKFIINLRPTRSQVVAKQRLGRILRPNEFNQNAVAVEFEDEIGEEDAPEDAPENAPYTVFDIFGKRKILQGGLLVEGREKKGDGEEPDERVPVSIPPELLKDLIVDTTLSRTLTIAGTKERAKKRKIDYADPAVLRAVLAAPMHPMDLGTCSENEFGKQYFGVSAGFEEVTGKKMLDNFGSKKRDSENFEALMRFAEVEREKIDFENVKHLQEILSPDPDLNFLASDFRMFQQFFRSHSRFGKFSGSDILKSFGDKTETDENYERLLKTAGIDHLDVNFSNQAAARKLVESVISSQWNYNFEKFQHAKFKIDSDHEIDGWDVLWNFGLREQSWINYRLFGLVRAATTSEQADEILNSARFRFYYKSTDSKEFTSLMGSVRFHKFKNAIFGSSTLLPPLTGEELLKRFGSGKVTTANMYKFIKHGEANYL